MEGMAGIVHLQQVMRGMPEYERSCRLMTAETNAAVAGTFGVRTALITGDQATIDEAAVALPGIEAVVVKEALGRQAARSLHPVEACRRIEAGAYRAYAEQGGRPLYQPKGPFLLEIDWMNASMADLCIQLP